MTPDISLEKHMPPHLPETPENGADTAASTPRIPKDVRFWKLRVWLRFLRIKLAKAILLPELAPGEAQQLRQSVHKDGALTHGYVLMCGLSGGIAMLGMLQSSTAVVIGAMLISPLMSPIAALGFGFASLDGSRIRDAARVVAVGAAIGILVGVLLTWLSPIRNATPEILGRTQPTLLDLAVALFSGLAGGYATVIRKGGTAIGVAIATALMPPLVVVGYGLGMLQPRFALGALLLFLTNLAAITFSFALIARISGVARPLYKVEWRPRYVAFFIAAFIVLATPLTLTLVRLSYEATMRSAAKSAILEASGGKDADLAQLDVSWPLFDEPKVDALVISPRYSANAEQVAEEKLAAFMGEKVEISLMQVQAADFESQARAMVDAAMERTAAGIAADVPPFEKIRAIIGLPTRSIWTDTAQRVVYVEPVPAPEWTTADYAAIERLATGADEKWQVRVIPPAQAQIRVSLSPETAGDETMSPALAVWALQRWGMSKVMLDAPRSEQAAALEKALAKAGIAIETLATNDTDSKPENAGIATIRVYARSPSKAAEAARQARIAAEQEAAGTAGEQEPGA